MFLRWWKERSTTNLVGLDIGPESIKILKINVNEHPYLVENYIIAPLPPGCVDKDQITEFSVVADTLKNIYEKEEIHSKSVAFAIPRSATIIKNIVINNQLTSEEVEARVWMEANRYFPDLVGDIYLDFIKLAPSLKDPNQTVVILIACRKDQIKPYLEVSKLAGLTLKVVDVNSYALERALGEMGCTQSGPNSTCALLNLDRNLSTLVVAQNRNLLYAHDETFDGQRLITQTKEYLKNVKDVADDEVAYFVLLKEMLSPHLRHAMHIFFSSATNMSISQLFISGDCAIVVPNLAAFIEQEIGIKTTLANPFDGWAIAKNIDAEVLKQNAPGLVLCWGLALTELEQLKKNHLKIGNN